MMKLMIFVQPATLLLDEQATSAVGGVLPVKNMPGD